MFEYKKRLEVLEGLLENALNVIDLEALKKEKLELDNKMLSPDFWDNPELAQEVSKKVSILKTEIDKWLSLKDQIYFLQEMFDANTLKEAEAVEMLEALEKEFDKMQIATFFQGKFDKSNVIITVICGLGGNDAQDFTKLLFEMYQKFAEKSDFEFEILDISYAESGYKNATIKIKGPFAFGWLKFEHGVHRLIRLSPFNSGNTRETSFAMVDVMPEIEFDDSLKIEESDIRVDVFRSSGPGGQSVNTTDSAVRITHLPTNIVVSCQSERSQHQNKENAMNLLRSKLVKLMHEKQAQTLDDLRGHKHEISFGSQIRTYTMHPYQLVKDHRTNFEYKNVDAVLAGEIEEFLRSEVENLTEM